jgi:hypothetical protein
MQCKINKDYIIRHNSFPFVSFLVSVLASVLPPVLALVLPPALGSDQLPVVLGSVHPFPFV